MTIDFSLNRDQRRLAETKLAALPLDHPLREKYELWISQLDERLAVRGKSFPIDKSAVIPPQSRPSKVDSDAHLLGNDIKLTPATMPDVLDSNANARKVQPPAASSEIASNRRQRLQFENRILRDMLERYQAPVSSRKSFLCTGYRTEDGAASGF
jgi:hypothetical protein